MADCGDARRNRVSAHFNRVGMAVAGKAKLIGPDGISEERMGIVYSAFLVVYTFGMLPGGWFIDRFGPRLALAAMALGLGICSVLTGLVGNLGLTIAALFVPLLLIRGLAGASSITLHPGAARAVSLWMPNRSRSTANGLVTAGPGWNRGLLSRLRLAHRSIQLAAGVHDQRGRAGVRWDCVVHVVRRQSAAIAGPTRRSENSSAATINRLRGSRPGSPMSSVCSPTAAWSC